MAWLLFGETIGLWGWLGLGFGIVGITLLGLPDEWIISLLQGQLSLDSVHGIDFVHDLFQNGQWLMLLASLSMAVGTVLMRYVSRYADPIAATGWHMILGGLPLFALSARFETDQFVHLDAANWLSIGYSTVFGSAIAYGLFFYFASSGSLTSLSSLTFLTPVFALFFGNLFLGEMLSQIQWIGVGLTLVSIYLINQRDVLAQKFQPLRQPAVSDALQLEQSETVAMPEAPQLPVKIAKQD
jgi:drug/metabolite transporter (DMT)-like permease